VCRRGEERNDAAGVRASSAGRRSDERDEVTDVVRHEDPVLARRELEHLVVGQRSERGIGGRKRDHVVPEPSERASNPPAREMSSSSRNEAVMPQDCTSRVKDRFRRPTNARARSRCSRELSNRELIGRLT
jgi:hypothetical protein